MSLAEVKISRWICGVIREKNIRDEYLRGCTGVASIVLDRYQGEYIKMAWSYIEEQSDWGSSISKENVYRQKVGGQEGRKRGEASDGG